MLNQGLLRRRRRLPISRWLISPLHKRPRVQKKVAKKPTAKKDKSFENAAKFANKAVPAKKTKSPKKVAKKPTAK